MNAVGMQHIPASLYKLVNGAGAMVVSLLQTDSQWHLPLLLIASLRSSRADRPARQPGRLMWLLQASERLANQIRQPAPQWLQAGRAQRRRALLRRPAQGTRVLLTHPTAQPTPGTQRAPQISTRASAMRRCAMPKHSNTRQHEI